MSVSSLTPSPNSTRPYLVRALYEWCTDNGYTPYIAAYVDETVQVPREHVKNNEIVLNISMDATSSLKLGNEFIEFKARFSGSARTIMVPMDRVIAIYARENGQGMAFPVPSSLPARGETADDTLARNHSAAAPGPALVPVSSANSAAGSQPDQAESLSPADAQTHETAAPAKVVQLVSVPVAQASDSLHDSESPSAPGDASQASPPTPPDDQPPEPPRLPPAGTSGRPALKRVK